MKDKIQGKINKHFPVYVNGHKCRILNYYIQNDYLTVITKINNSNFGIRGDTGELVIKKGGVKTAYIVEYCTSFYGNTIRHTYHIREEKRTNIDEVNSDFHQM